MKAAVVVIALSLLVSSAPVCAQEFMNEVSFSLGAATFPDITETTKDIALLIGTIGFIRTESERATPALVFKYGRFINENLRASLVFGYQRFDVKHFLMEDSWLESEVSYYSFILRGDYTWLRRTWVNLYSGAGMGLAVVAEKDIEEVEVDNEYWFAFHLNALGVRVGKRVAGFVELGFGYEGIMSAGITAGF